MLFFFPEGRRNTLTAAKLKPEEVSETLTNMADAEEGLQVQSVG